MKFEEEWGRRGIINAHWTFSVKHFIYFIAYGWQILLSSVFRWGNWGLKKLKNMVKSTWTVRGGARTLDITKEALATIMHRSQSMTPVFAKRKLYCRSTKKETGTVLLPVFWWACGEGMYGPQVRGATGLSCSQEPWNGPNGRWDQVELVIREFLVSWLLWPILQLLIATLISNSSPWVEPEEQGPQIPTPWRLQVLLSFQGHFLCLCLKNSLPGC